MTGALEAAFWVMDSVVLSDKRQFRITGGSTALALHSNSVAAPLVEVLGGILD